MGKYLIILIFLTTPCLTSELRAGSQELISKQEWLRNSKNYDYTENIRKRSEKKRKSSGNFHLFPEFSNAKLKIVIIIIVILVLSFIILLIVLNLYKGVKEKVTPENFSVKSLNPDDLDQIEDHDLIRILNEALNAGLYKDAVRIRYLMLIRKLDRLNLVIWKKDKTNGMYIEEMYGKKGFDQFRRITVSFERIWYGERETRQKDYLVLEPVFDEMNKTLLPTNLLVN